MTITEEDLQLAQPPAPHEVTLEAWYMDDSEEDQRLPHRQTPNKPCSPETLAQLGVTYWKLDPEVHETDPKLAAIRKVHNYSYMEIITITRDTLPDYDKKLKIFYEEHIHTDDEIRYILDGSGYFDVRDFDDQWIRIATKKGDMIVLPEGIYHRFTLDEHNSTKAMRLFVGEPVWVPYNRPQEEHASRLKYLSKYAPKKAEAMVEADAAAAAPAADGAAAAPATAAAEEAPAAAEEHGPVSPAAMAEAAASVHEIVAADSEAVQLIEKMDGQVAAEAVAEAAAEAVAEAGTAEPMEDDGKENAGGRERDANVCAEEAKGDDASEPPAKVQKVHHEGEEAAGDVAMA